MDSFQISSEFLEEAFPFHAVLDHNLLIIELSNRFREVAPEIVPGQDIANVLFSDEKNASECSKATLASIDDSHILQSRHIVGLQFNCATYRIGDDSLLLACTPIINSSGDLKEHSISYDDFARHDPILAHVSIIQARDASIRDVKEITESLEKKIEARTRELSKSMEEAIIATRTKTSFLSSMSHELRTPLNAIMGFAQMMEINSKEPLTDTQQLSVDQIMSGSRHLLELINQVLELHKIESGTMSLEITQVSIRSVIHESINLVAAKAFERNISIVNNMADFGDRFLWTDGRRLVQILINFFSNAIKYNHKGGSVRLYVTEPENDVLRFSVTDTGLGISKDNQVNIFMPFERLGREGGEIEGTGIGLTITKQITEALDGVIGFESEENKGSTFWVDLPVGGEPETE